MRDKRNRGQLFSGDIAVAMVVFLATLGLAFFLWNSTTDDINRAERLRDLQRIAASTTEQLIRTPGVPADWDTQWDLQGSGGSVSGIPGLAADDRVIDPVKAGSFVELMNATYYEDYKHFMGLGEYDFYIDVRNLTGTLMEVSGKPFAAGKPLPAEYTESVSILRTAIFNDTIVRVNLIIWR